MGKPAMSGVKKNKKKGFKPSRGKTPGGRVYEVAQEILNAPEGGVAAVIAAALNDKEAPIRRDPRAFTMFSTRCRKKGDWSKCVEIFDAMRDQGVETNTIVYNATMSACSKGGDWERALELFETMPREGHDRSTITYNVAMSACMRGGDWERALELFDQMAEEGLEILERHRDRLRLEDADPDRKEAILDPVVEYHDRLVGGRIQHERLHFDLDRTRWFAHTVSIVSVDPAEVKRRFRRFP